MCKPASEGGQRCAAHTRTALDKAVVAVSRAEARIEQALESGNDRAFEAAQADMDRAMEDLHRVRVEHASTPTGAAEFQAIADDHRYGKGQQEYYAGILAKGAALREKNQAVADALAAAAAKKAATAAPSPTEVSLDQVELESHFYWDGETHLLHDLETDEDDEDMWVAHTATGVLYIPKSDTVETVEEDESDLPYETDEERFAAIRDEEAQVAGDPVAAAPVVPRTVRLSEDDFEAQYGSVLQTDLDEDANAYWDEPPTDQYPTNRIWTVVENGENENHYLLPGVNYVNRIGYIASEKPWTDPKIEVLYFDHENLMDKD